MSETTNVELVKGLYAAFDRGDLPGILQTLAPDIVWNWARVDGIPHSGLRHGPNEVAKFFEEIAAVEEPIDFPRVDFVAQGDRVVVLGKYRARVRATGRIWESDYAHIWTVRDGLIAGYDLQYNTAAALAAYHADADDRRAIDVQHERFMTAMRTGDPSAFGDLLADDVVFMPPYQRERRGKQDVLAWFAEFVSQVRTVAVDASNREVVVSGDAAFDGGAFTWTVQPLAGGAPIEDRGHFMAMLQRQADGTWKVTRDLWNSSVPVAAAV